MTEDKQFKLRKSHIFWLVMLAIIILWNFYVFMKLGGFSRVIPESESIITYMVFIIRYAFFGLIKWATIILVGCALIGGLGVLSEAIIKWVSKKISELNDWLDEKL